MAGHVRSTRRHPIRYRCVRKCLCFDEPFDPPMVRRALAAYFGLVSFLDHNIGTILHALEETGLAGETRVIYSSDHGDNLGTRGLWGKSTMSEESAGIPLIMAGPDITAGQVCPTPVTLVDAFPTIIQGAGAQSDPSDAVLPGASWLDIAQGRAPRRTILSEYHAAGAPCGSFMIRRGRYKYIHYVGLPRCCSIRNDPRERTDSDAIRLAQASAARGTAPACHPDAVDRSPGGDSTPRLHSTAARRDPQRAPPHSRRRELRQLTCINF